MPSSVEPSAPSADPSSPSLVPSGLQPSPPSSTAFTLGPCLSKELHLSNSNLQEHRQVDRSACEQECWRRSGTGKDESKCHFFIALSDPPRRERSATASRASCTMYMQQYDRESIQRHIRDVSVTCQVPAAKYSIWKRPASEEPAPRPIAVTAPLPPSPAAPVALLPPSPVAPAQATSPVASLAPTGEDHGHQPINTVPPGSYSRYQYDGDGASGSSQSTDAGATSNADAGESATGTGTGTGTDDGAVRVTPLSGGIDSSAATATEVPVPPADDVNVPLPDASPSPSPTVSDASASGAIVPGAHEGSAPQDEAVSAGLLAVLVAYGAWPAWLRRACDQMDVVAAATLADVPLLGLVLRPLRPLQLPLAALLLACLCACGVCGYRSRRCRSAQLACCCCCCCSAARRCAGLDGSTGTDARSRSGTKHEKVGGRNAKGNTYAVSFADEDGGARQDDTDGTHANGYGSDFAAGDLISADFGDLIEMTDVLVDEPTPSAASGIKMAHGARAAAGGSQVCSYEELGEQNLSDCSADDFDIIVDHPPKNKGRSRVMGASSPSGGLLIGRGSNARSSAVEKRSLLTDVDVLVS